MNGNPHGKSTLSPVKQAYLKLEELQSKLEAIDRARREPIAIVGMGCRFPGASHDPEAFWRFLREGRDAICEVPADRWNIDEYYDPNPGTPGKMYTRNGSFLDRVDLFDPQFFGIAPREAIGMDPQQRLLLEVTWEALERSGIAPDKLSGSRTGVFVGLCTSDYADLQLRSHDVTKLDAYHASGIAHSIASGRLSYVLGLQGPCMTVDTACSSSLVAVHLACQSLRGRECNMALAGGVSVILSPDMFIALSKASMLAPDGRCKTFDASADGYARGEGCGVVVLRRLSDALADGDPILALIRGSAINQDGPSSGLTAPNGPSQTAVIRDALTNGGVRPEEVSYVETHGTGTSLGDPIEVQALGAAYCENRPPDRPLLIGALKSNIGHLEGAAGVAGLIKLVLALQHGEIPPSLHVKKPNPFIPWEDLAVKVTTQLSSWDLADKTRLAGLSAFGFSGTNAHIVVQEAPVAGGAPAEVERPLHLLALSARGGEALDALAERFRQQLSTHTGEGIGNICHTANSGRAHWRHRAAILAGSVEQMCEKLGHLTSATLPAGVYKGQTENSDRLKIAFLFTGQGSQYSGMARELYETQPAFKRVLDQCGEILRDKLHPHLLSVLYPEAGQTSPLDETAYTQPALFSLEYALSQLWMSWGIHPGAVMGHSVGEYVAACVAGVFSLEEGLKLIAARGRLMQKCERGLMAAVFGDGVRVAAELEGYRDRVAIAALNGPANTVISGRSEAVEELLDKFALAGMKTKRLMVSHAFHSPLMDPMLKDFAETASTMNYRPPRLALVSNLSGRMVSSEEISRADYWVRHAREAVNFVGSMRTLQEKGFQAFLEIGPSPTLSGMGAKCLPEGFGMWLPSLRKGRGDWQQMLESLAALYVHGAEVDWREFDRGYRRRRVVLPTYPFQRKRYWTEVPKDLPAGKGESSSGVPRRTLGHPLLHRRLDSPFLQDVVIESDISPADLPWLNDHQAFEQRVLPATAYLEMSLAAAGEAFGSGTFTIRDIDIREAMTLDAGASLRVQIAVTPLEGDAASFQIASLTGAPGAGTKWKIHAAGRIQIDPAGADLDGTARSSLADARSRCQREIPVEAYHQQFADLGMYLGPSFKGLKRLWLGSHEVLAQVRLVPEIASEARLYRVHPGLLDACLQPFAAAALSPEELASGGVIYMPVALESYRVYREPGEDLWSHVVLRPGQRQAEPSTTVKVDVSVFDDAGALVAEAEGLSLRRVDRQVLAKSQDKSPEDWVYELKWSESLLPVSSPRPRGRWIVFADRGGLGASLGALLQPPSGHCVTVFAGRRYEALGEASYRIDPGSPEDFQRVLHDAAGTDGSPFEGVAYLWPLDSPNSEIANFDDLNAGIRRGCEGLLHLVKALVSDGSSKVGSLWIVTRGAQSASSFAERVALAQAPVSAMGSTIALEFPELHCSRIDLDPGEAPDEASDLAGEIQSRNDEDLIAFRHGRRHVARLSRVRSDSAPADERHGLDSQRAYRLQTSAPGMLDRLALQPLERRQPGPDEVEIAVLATGLTFRDVLMALGRYPGVSNVFGNECVGRIVALGPGVRQFQPGQRVIVMGPGSFASHMTLAAHDVMPVPDSLSDEDAAGIPSAFLTAYYALCHLARIAPGDRVLIHAAAGGVGLAAVQLAQRAGAEIFATAGNERKRDYLKSLGVAHVMDSRSLDFADDILRETHGRGVDIVLNSLAGEFIEKSFSVTAAHGRFLEIGNTGIWDEARVAQLNRNISYHPINLATTFQETPGLLGGLLADLLKEFEEGRLKPLPLKVFPIAEVTQAFRYMAQARHIGKIVVSHAGAANGGPAGSGTLSRRNTGFNADGCYWITGGLAGIGLLVTRWIVEQGARHVVVTARSEPSEQALEAIRRMEQKGAEVVVARGDVSDRSYMDEVFSKFGRSLPPLRGIIHCAGAWDDGILLHQSWERFQKVFAAKVAGSWHLHELTKDLPLDFFVLFSSAVSLLGSAGQVSYVAACAFEDGLASYRRALGLPALSIDWGPWAETGAATRGTIRQRVQSQGFQLIQPERGLRVLQDLLGQDRTRTGVLSANWRQFSDSLPRRSALLSELTLQAEITSPGVPRKPGQTQDLLQQFNQAAPGKRRKLLMEYVQRQAVKVLGLDSTQYLDPKQPLSDLGLDSLMAVELRSLLGTELGLSRSLPAALAFDYPTIAALTEYLAEEVLLWEKPQAPPPESPREEEDISGALDRIEGLSEEEVDRIYSQEKEVG